MMEKGHVNKKRRSEKPRRDLLACLVSIKESHELDTTLSSIYQYSHGGDQ